MTRIVLALTDIPSWLRGTDVAILRPLAANGDITDGEEGGGKEALIGYTLTLWIDKHFVLKLLYVLPAKNRIS